MKLWKFLLLLGALAVAGGVVVLGVNFLVLPAVIHHNEVVVMPDVRGLTVRGAASQLRGDGLTVEVARSRAHPTVPEGMILDQSPAPEAKVRGGRRVQVITSSGPPAGALPQLAGLTLRQAEITLQRESYKLGRVLRLRRPGVTEPVISYQEPMAGTHLLKGADVNLVVAEPAPAELMRMPDLLGQPLYRVRRSAAAAGFVLAPVTYRRTSGQAPNTILQQKPAPGGRIRKGEQLELVVSSR